MEEFPEISSHLLITTSREFCCFFFLNFIHLSFNMNLCGKYAVLLTQTIWPEDLYDKKITQSEEGQSNRPLRRPLCFYYDIAFLYKTQ